MDLRHNPGEGIRSFPRLSVSSFFVSFLSFLIYIISIGVVLEYVVCDLLGLMMGALVLDC